MNVAVRYFSRGGNTKKLADAIAAAVEVPAEVQALIDARNQARKAKDFATADQCRAKIKELGYEIKDTPQGTTCKKCN